MDVHLFERHDSKQLYIHRVILNLTRLHGQRSVQIDRNHVLLRRLFAVNRSAHRHIQKQLLLFSGANPDGGGDFLPGLVNPAASTTKHRHQNPEC